MQRQKSTWNRWLILLLSVLFVLFFAGGPDYYSIRSLKHFWNTGHILFFALLTYLALNNSLLLKGRYHWSVNLLLCLLVTALLGSAIELIQSTINRSIDWNDFWRNILGTLFGFFLTSQSFRRTYRLLGLSCLTVLLVIQSVPWFEVLLDEYRARQQFPLLSNFESEVELTRWKGSAQSSISDDKVSSGDYSMKVTLGTEQYSGVGLKYFPADWSQFDKLKISLYSTVEHLSVVFRIHDALHIKREFSYKDRFSRRMVLKQGWNDIEIDLEEVASAPASRSMDLHQIRDFSLFVMRQPRRQVIYVDDVKLAEQSKK